MPRGLEFDVEAVRADIMRQFWLFGYEATSLSDLERVTSLVRTSLYNAFGKKSDMFLDSLGLYHAMVETQIDTALKGRGCETLADVVAGMIEGTTGASTQPRGCLMVNAATQSANLDARHIKAVRDYRQMLVSKARQLLEHDRQSGRLRQSVDPDSAAEFLICVFWGALATQCLSEDSPANGACAQVLRATVLGWIAA